MSNPENRVSLISIAIGTFVPVAFAAIVASALAPMPFMSFGWRGAFYAALCGAGLALIIGFVMSWHGGAIGGSSGRSDNAWMWGILTGAVVGTSLGPPLGAAVGLFVGHVVDGAKIGLILGAIVGIAAWELSYSSDEILESLRRRRASRQ